MDSDLARSNDMPVAETAAAETPTTTRRRSRSTRSTRATQASTTPDHAAGAAPANDDVLASLATSLAPADETAPTPAPARSGRSRSRSGGSPAAEAAAPVAPEPPAEVLVPLSSGDALMSEGPVDQAPAADESIGRSRRRRRGRGGRNGEAVDQSAASQALDAAIASNSHVAARDTAALPDSGDLSVADEIGLPSDTAALEADSAVGETAAPESATASRRRRRRGRNGRTALEPSTVAENVEAVADLAPASAAPSAPLDTAESPLPGADSADRTAAALSPAVLRRFDHRDWRDRPTRPHASAAGRPAPAVAAPPVELPFREETRSFARGARRDERRPTGRVPEHTPPALEPPPAAAEPSIASVPYVTPPPIVMPADVSQPAISARDRVAAAAPSFMPSIPRTGGVDDRLERLIEMQSTLLQQQQQVLQSMAATMSALQGAIDRMTTSGIAAGMPRTGVFVDAPNIVYAAENARINIDYGRLLDFVCRGREMVHAIVYAPVTEESASRPETQRFVAPFLHKGYKLVTKPLKRFPDGTAKGNFDIELAIDIVTMAERLDVVVLISGDSDFSRLIELVQSRGVRVEVVAFAANVSWELVQMADVFIDVARYVDEFRVL